jgi:hypothetical protein
MKKILIFNKLKSQVNFQDIPQILQDEPLHPYMGVKWTKVLIDNGLTVEYLNKYISSKVSLLNFFYKFIILPTKFSTIVVYSTNGLGLVTLLRLFNWKINIVFFSLSKINPDGNFLKVNIRKLFFYADIKLANHVVVGLNELRTNSIHTNSQTYFPFYSDVNFFQEKINKKINNNILDHISDYILVVGDITRDDFYVYTELEDLKIPIIRVTRDKKVISILNNLINRDRGDLILSGISFEELASLYSNSKLGIIASKFDHWQPGGITSIVESLACNAISLCNSGGEIEKEFSHLTFNSKYSDPLFYFNYPEKGSLKKNVIDLLNKSEEDLSKLKSNSCEFASEVLNMNAIGISKLESLIRNFFK